MRFSKPVLVLLGLLSLVGSAAASPARVFDDVEIFPLQRFINLSGGLMDFTHSGIPAASCMAGSRRFLLTHAAETELSSTGSDDWILVRHTGFGLQVGTPILTLEYDFSAQPIDLTFGGDHDRFHLRLLNVEPGDISVTVEIESVGGTPGVLTFPATDGKNIFPFGYFGMLASQWTQVTKVRIHFVSEVSLLPVAWRLHWIRLTSPTTESGIVAVPAEDDGDLKPLVPVPPPPYEAEWTWTDPSGGPYEELHTSLDMVMADALPQGPYPGEVVAHAAANGASALDLTVHSTAADIQEGRFILGLEFLENGTAPELFYPPDPFHEGEKLVVLLVHLQLPVPGTVDHGGHVYQRIRLEIPEDSPMVFENLLLDGFGGGNNLFLDFRLVRSLPDAYGPGIAFTMNVLTDWQPEAVSTPAPSPVDGLRLSAFPSVSSGATMLRLNRAAVRSHDVVIFDARGRRVRRLALGSGERLLAWDGRDGRGQSLASGKYFVRVEGEDTLPTVLTIVR